MRLSIALSCFVAAGVAHAEDVSGRVAGVSDRENVVVYIEHVDGKFETPKDHAVMDQLNMEFVPHVLAVLSGTTVDFPNSDTVRHNVYSPTKAKKFNLGIYPVGVTKQQVMDIPGAQAVSLLCAIHAQLAAFIVVLQNPYFTQASHDGTFTIKDVPEGSYMLVAWHEKQPDAELPKVKISVAKGTPLKVNLSFKNDYGHTGARASR